MRNVILFLIARVCFCCTNKSGNHEIKSWKLAPGIYILDKEKSVNSLADLSGFFKDKTVYIDRWAT